MKSLNLECGGAGLSDAANTGAIKFMYKAGPDLTQKVGQSPEAQCHRGREQSDNIVR